VPKQLKTCRSCGIEKPLSKFHKEALCADGRRGTCKECRNPQEQEMKKSERGVADHHRSKRNEFPEDIYGKMGSKERSVSMDRNTQLIRSYGISLEVYNNMLDIQEGKCAICGEYQPVYKSGKQVTLAVDHCHATGVVRGLLCSPCNKGIGHMKDDTSILYAAINYLEKAHP